MAEEVPYVLFVEGKWDPSTPKLKNKLTIYFQSKKSNGGDCCVQHLEGQQATVGFKTEEVRRNVLERRTHKMKLGQNRVSLNVFLPPEATQESRTPVRADQTAVRSQEELPAEHEKAPAAEPQTEEAEVQDPGEESEVAAVLENLQDMSQEFLVMLVESVLKEESESKDFTLEVLSESNCAVITFTNRKAAETFILSSPAHSVFRKNNLAVRPLEKTTKVKAEDLPSNLNADHIFLYFEKFGEIECDVEMFEDGQSAIITFQDHTALSRVLRAKHQIKKQPFRVFPYYESLKTTLYGKDRPTLRLPETFTENIDQSLLQYLKDNPGSLNLIKQEMFKHFCQIDLRDASVKISPLASLLHQGLQTRKLIQTWKEKASAEFTAAVSKYKSLEINVQRDVWSEMEAEIHKTLIAEPVTFLFQEDRGAVILAGLVEDVGRTGDVVHNVLNRITQRIQREKGSISDDIVMVPSIYRIVMLDGLEQEIGTSFPEMDLSYHSHSRKLALYGLKQEVLESKNKILQEVIGLKRRMVELHPSSLEFLSKRDQEELTSELFLSKGIRASLEIKENQALLVAKTEKTLKDSESHLKAVLNHECLDIEDPSVLRKVEWQDLLTNLNNSFNSPTMTVVIDTSGSQVLVSGFADAVKLVLEQLSDFVQNNSNMVTAIEADSIVVRFIKEHKKQDWFETVKNKVKVDFNDGKILLSGPRVHVSQCKPIFENLCSSVYHRNLKVSKPGAKKFFKSKETMYVAAAKEVTGCVIELVDGNEVLQASGGVSIEKKGVLTPQGVEIVVSKGNMCFYPVDAVVNASNDKLDFNGGLSKVLSDAAGPQLQDACRQILTKRKLTVGDAVITKAGGQLCCKYVIHVVEPHYKGSDPQKAVGLLKKALRRSLNLADQEYCQSMAIPAVSSGNLGFPLDLCASTIVGALKEFFEIVGGDLCLKKIHLVDNNDRTVEALEAAVQKVYGSSSTSHGKIVTVKQSHHQQNLNLDLMDESFTPDAIMQQRNKGLKEKDDQQHKEKDFVIEGKVLNVAYFSICGPTRDAVDQAEQWIEDLISDEQVFESITDSVILSLSDKDLQRILELQQSLDVRVRVEHKVQGGDKQATIFVEGLSKDVLMTVSEIQTTLKEIRKEAGLKRDIEVTSELVEWQYQQCGQYQSFDPLTNFSLEQAFTHKSPHVDITFQGQAFKVTMPEGPAVSAVGGNQINIKRVDKTKDSTKTPAAFCDAVKRRFGDADVIQDEESTTASSFDLSKGTIVPEIKYSKQLPKGVKISVWKDDLTTHKADAVVNAVNERLNHGVGLSLALSRAGGPQIQQQCDKIVKVKARVLTGEAVVTSAGKLPCQYIIHAVGPCVPPNPSGRDIAAASHLLEKAIQSIFQCTEYRELQSVAIPAISSGLYNFPLDLCADIIVNSVSSFIYARHSKSGSLEIRLVNNDDPSVQEMLRACNKFLGPPDSYIGTVQTQHTSSPKSARPSLELSGTLHPRKGLTEEETINSTKTPAAFCDAVKRRFGDADVIQDEESTTASSFDLSKGTIVPEIKYSKQLPKGVKISVWKDDLTTHKADAVVNAANERLNHGVGLSLALSRAGGPQIQQQCDRIVKVKGCVLTGEAVVTSAGKLPCQYIIHAVGPCVPPNPSRRDIAAASPLLEKAIQRIFQLTEHNSLQSVAIPAISTGLYNFPLDLCADIIVNSVSSFIYARHPQSGSLEIRLVNNDDPSVQEMLRACNKFLGPPDS